MNEVRVTNQYDADYFLRGKETGLSLYTDYHWMPELTGPMVRAIANHLNLWRSADTVLDFGCARGYVVRALRELGHIAYGFDTSNWAIENGDKEVYQFLSHRPEVAFSDTYDWVIAKDVLEHIPAVADTISTLLDTARKGVFAVVPLSAVDGELYIVGDYERDVTHIHRLTLTTWAQLFLRSGWSVEVRYRLPGVKDNYFRPGWHRGNGFITARRLQRSASEGRIP